MHFAGHAFVDWDDTIAENIRYFNEARDANVILIARVTKSDPALVQARGDELDLEVARRVGLGRDSLQIAWQECYRQFCRSGGVAENPDTLEAIRLACQIPYKVRQELLPGAVGALEWLGRSGFEVCIWTAGDEAVQARKIRDSGLQHLIHRQVIVPGKTPERLLAALDGRDRERSFVVGNSLHSDIRPALAVGLTAFHVPTETWAYDEVPVDFTDPGYVRVESISRLPEVLTGRFRLAV